MIAAALLLAGGAGAADGPSENEVKAAFLYNFAKFVEWPPAVLNAPAITLCVTGEDGLGGALDVIQGKPVGTRPLRVVRLMTLDDVAACHVLFVASYEFTTVSRVVRGLAARPILTVGTAPGFARAGGLIGFTSVNGRVRFEINPQAAARAGLKINAQLLKLAIIVGEGE